MSEYFIVIETTDTGYSAYAPEVDGCIAAGKTVEETEALMNEALEFHLEGMVEEGFDIPAPHSVARYARIAA